MIGEEYQNPAPAIMKKETSTIDQNLVLVSMKKGTITMTAEEVPMTEDKVMEVEMDTTTGEKI